MARVISISDRYLSTHDHLVLKSLLTLVESRTGREWSYSDHKESDVVIIDWDHERSSEALKTLAEAKSQSLLVMLSENAPDNGHLHLPKPIRSKDLVEILDEAASNLDKPRAVVTASETEPEVDSSEVTTIDLEGKPALLSFVAEHLASQNKDSYVLSKDDLVLVIDFGSGLYKLDGAGEALKVFCRADHISLSIESSVIALDLDDEAKPLASLAWYVALLSSKGVWLYPLNDYTRFQLKRWPNISTMKRRQQYARIAAYLTKYTMNITQLASSAKVEKDLVINFLNASYLADLLVVEQQQEQVEKHVESPNKGLFGRLRKKLGIGGADNV